MQVVEKDNRETDVVATCAIAARTKLGPFEANRSMQMYEVQHGFLLKVLVCKIIPR